MITNFYERQLVILTALCLLSLALERFISKPRQLPKQSPEERLENGTDPRGVNSLAKLTQQYLVVYALVMGADWLQGPYVYSLYREQYGFPERYVAILFVTGFLSAAVSGPLVGVWADQHGRKRICQAFCITYALTCACLQFPSLPILLLGRILGGISTSILFSAFESWLVSASTNAGLSSSDLSLIFGRATLVNGFVAAGAGIASNKLVASTGTFTSPFIASGILLVLSYFVIKNSWSENFGTTDKNASADPFQTKRLKQAWRIVRQDPLLLVLGLTQTCFEGSMYLFVFLWVPFLQEASGSSQLPLGYIFSSFMVSMMLGSVLYTFITQTLPSVFSSSNSSKTHPSNNGQASNGTGATISSLETTDSANTQSLTLHAKLSSCVCALSALSLAASISVRSAESEQWRFWAFCGFEACVGMYYPVQGMLRGSLISNEHRATLSALFRVPLNIFVVVSLLTGVSSARYAVLTASTIMLSFSAVMTGLVIVDRVDGKGDVRRKRPLTH
ncbi:DUF791-domain-containing protein [Dendrothele bispora CBS 962.96]|uniref:Molybdate-anion transporter n=1 Tax=Dendrothele bispora (strain CBS 962.96) TaxID=1314807 RepID=A0A4S8MNZ9_DENBC|nr:DUF791-domain-containing protein [Dendrothele bispora CBS 962.96]